MLRIHIGVLISIGILEETRNFFYKQSTFLNRLISCFQVKTGDKLTLKEKVEKRKNRRKSKTRDPVETTTEQTVKEEEKEKIEEPEVKKPRAKPRTRLSVSDVAAVPPKPASRQASRATLKISDPGDKQTAVLAEQPPSTKKSSRKPKNPTFTAESPQVTGKSRKPVASQKSASRDEQQIADGRHVVVAESPKMVSPEVAVSSKIMGARKRSRKVVDYSELTPEVPALKIDPPKVRQYYKRLLFSLFSY